MNRITRRPSRAASTVASSFVLAGLLAAPAFAGSPSVQTVRPGHGIIIDVGSKHVVGYFVAEAKACQVTLLMGDRTTEGEVPERTAARIRQTVLPNAVARIETAEGDSLELACNAGTRGLTMQVKTTVAVAAYAPAR